MILREYSWQKCEGRKRFIEKLTSHIKPLQKCIIFKENHENKLQTRKSQNQEKNRICLGDIYIFAYCGLWSTWNRKKI